MLPIPAAPLALGQPFFTVDAVESHPVHLPTFTAQQNAQAQMAETVSFGQQFVQTPPEWSVFPSSCDSRGPSHGSPQTHR